jgi:transcription antitermination factor NusG
MSNAESTVATSLRAAGIEAFNPTYQETVEWSDRRKILRRPLFPGYVFALAHRSRLREIVQLAGVLRVLPSDMNPEPVPDAEIENVRQALATRLPAEPCAYVAGDQVRIESGPLAGVTGIVDRTKNGTRVIVRVEMLRRAVSIDVDAADVLKVAA